MVRLQLLVHLQEVKSDFEWKTFARGESDIYGYPYLDSPATASSVREFDVSSY